MMHKIAESELILNKDGSVYHLNLLPEDVADTVITVGDPDRVDEVSRYFDSVEIKKHKREFVTHTGFIGKQRITVISTGISTDNIDIVFNELDALVNIDLKERTIKPQLKSLDIIRVGTAGGLQPAVATDSFVVSSNAIGMDGLASFYHMIYNSEEVNLREDFISHFNAEPASQNAYAIAGNNKLVNTFGSEHTIGTTVTCGGFYGPQGRTLRLRPTIDDFINRLQNFTYQGQQITNFEMETAGIYALGKLMGHRCCSLSVIAANRCTGEFSKNITHAVDKLIRYTLEKLTATVAVTPNIG